MKPPIMVNNLDTAWQAIFRLQEEIRKKDRLISDLTSELRQSEAKSDYLEAILRGHAPTPDWIKK